MSSQPPPKPASDASSNPVAAQGPASVLDAIARLTGADAPRVNLRETPSASGGTPVLKAGPAVQSIVPQGRGNYQLQGEIARGGMGVILKGHDTDLGRDVALKVLREDLAKRPEIVQRFVEEAQIGGQLQHPGVVPVYELGLMADQRPYFAMKLVKGRTLAETLLERKQDERRRLLDVFAAVCQTVAYAHSKGVVHRDLKPANILIGAFGEVQVVDWGLAKVLRRGGVHDEKRSQAAHASRASIIETVRSAPGSVGSDSLVGSVMGTPAYMPPEQARGDVEKLDERSDVFSLGAILCEILTGAPPYRGDPEQTIDQAAHARLDEATKRLDECDADRELVALAKDCLTPAPAARPRSAEVLAERMQAHLTSVEERVRAAQIRAAEAKVRARATALLSVAGIALVLLGGGGWLLFDAKQRERRAQTAARVDDALATATLERGRRKWKDATTSLEQALALLDAGEATDAQRQRVKEQLAGVAKESAEAERQAEQERQNRELLAHLVGLRAPEAGGAGSMATATTVRESAQELDDSYTDAFSAYGLELDALGASDAAQQLVQRGIGEPAAAALDDWAHARSLLGKGDDAEHLVQIALAADPDVTRSRLRRAILIGDRSLLREFTRDEDLAKLPASSLNLLATAFKRLGSVTEAIRILKLAQTIHPDDFVVNVNLGITLLEGNSSGPMLEERPPQFDDASRCFMAALAAQPDDPRIQARLGRMLAVELGEAEQGIALLERAVRASPETPEVHLAYGIALRSLGDAGRAIPEFRELVRLRPKDSEAHWGLGRSLSDAGDTTGAIASLREAIRLDPSNERARFSLAFDLLDADDAQGALAECKAAIALGQVWIGTTWANAFTYAALRDRDSAQRWLEDAVTTTSQLEPMGLRFSAEYLLVFPISDLRDPARATLLLQRAIELAPKWGNLWLILGWARLLEHDPKGCIEAEERAMKLMAGGTAQHWFLLAMAREQLGEHAAALDWWSRADDWMTQHRCRNRNVLALGAAAGALLERKSGER
jgi:serine/threonine-protein kinase